MARSPGAAPAACAAGLLVIFAAACGSSGEGASSSSAGETRPAVAATGPVDLMAAASLTDVIEGGAEALEAEDPAWDITPKFAGSQDLVRQIEEGNDGDVVALADPEDMEVLQDDGLVEDPVIFATNELVIAVQPGNPRGIDSLGDLADPGLNVVLADPSVPAGRYAAQALRRAGVEVRPRSLELDVRSTLAKVSERVADAAIVYATDVRAKDHEVDGVAIPAQQNVIARYPVAVLADAAHPEAARAFVGSLVSGALRGELERAGFGAP